MIDKSGYLVSILIVLRTQKTPYKVYQKFKCTMRFNWSNFIKCTLKLAIPYNLDNKWRKLLYMRRFFKDFRFQFCIPEKVYREHFGYLCSPYEMKLTQSEIQRWLCIDDRYTSLSRREISSSSQFCDCRIIVSFITGST